MVYSQYYVILSNPKRDHYHQIASTEFSSDKQQTTNGIFITTHENDSAYFAILFNICEPKQSKEAITDIDESSSEIFSVVAALVIDIYQGTQTAKTLFSSNIARKQPLNKFIKQRFLSLCSLTYINNQSIYDTKNFTVGFVDTCCCRCRLFCLMKMNIEYTSKIYSIIIMCCDKYTPLVVCQN